MRNNLIEYLDNQSPKRFQPKPYYCPDSDTLTFYFKDADSYAERIGDLVTVYRGIEGNELVGCKVKGVRHQLSVLGDFGVVIKTRKMSLNFLFLAYWGQVEKSPETRETIRKIAREAAAANAHLDTRGLVPELQPA